MGKLAGAALLFLLGGCYVEGSAGYYSLTNSHNTSSDRAYSFGIAAGVFIDPGPVRVAVGAGGDYLVAEQNLEDAPRANQEHHALGLHVRVDPRLAYLNRRGDQLTLSMSYAVRWGQPIEIDYGDTEVRVDGVTQSFFLGPGFYFRFGRGAIGGLLVSVGPALMHTATDEPYGMTAIGGQLRIAGGAYPNLSSIGGFTKMMVTARPGETDAAMDRMMEERWRNFDEVQRDAAWNSCMARSDCYPSYR